MIQDPSDEHIKAICAAYELSGKAVLEIGCGTGRITRDLAKYAAQVVATDPDSKLIAVAAATSNAEHVEFLSPADGIPDFPHCSFDLAIYTLSLHHVPLDAMQTSLQRAGQLLKETGAIMVIEPGDGGSFNEAKERFGAGSGDEQQAKSAAIHAMRTLDGWDMSETSYFQAGFLFSDENDFIIHKRPDFAQLPKIQQQQISDFLQAHMTPQGILLTNERRLNLLQKSTAA